MIDYKGRVESYSRDLLRKESQIKELQSRMDTGDGCEYQHLSSYIVFHFSSVGKYSIANSFSDLDSKIKNFHAFTVFTVSRVACNPSNFLTKLINFFSLCASAG